MKPLFDIKDKKQVKGDRDNRKHSSVNLKFVSESEREKLTVRSYGYLLP